MISFSNYYETRRDKNNNVFTKIKGWRTIWRHNFVIKKSSVFNNSKQGCRRSYDIPLHTINLARLTYSELFYNKYRFFNTRAGDPSIPKKQINGFPFLLLNKPRPNQSPLSLVKKRQRVIQHIFHKTTYLFTEQFCIIYGTCCTRLLVLSCVICTKGFGRSKIVLFTKKSLAGKTPTG